MPHKILTIKIESIHPSNSEHSNTYSVSKSAWCSWILLAHLLRSHTWFCCSSDKFGILLELDVVIALVLHQHHLQIDVITYLELPHTPVSLLVQGHCCSHVAVVCISCTHTYTHSVKIKKKKRIKYRHIYRPLSEC